MQTDSMKSVCFSLVALLFVTLQVQAQSGQTAPGSSSCMVRIVDPAKGAPVEGSGLVSGKAALPANGHLWIFAHLKTLNGSWWPQGGGEAEVQNGAFSVTVVYGSADDVGDFEIAAVVVNDATSKMLDHWVDTAPARNYAPTHFPPALDGCVPVRLMVVKR